MDKPYIEEIFVGETHPEGTLARMERERQIAYIMSRINIRMGKQTEEMIVFITELLRETMK